MPSQPIDDSYSQRASAFDFRELEAFVAVVDTGSFTVAAQTLFLSQPTVSARIAALEAALDVKLLDRRPGNVRPTPAGEVLLPNAKALLRDREGAMQAVAGFLGRLTGTLRAGASSIPGAYLLPRAIAELRAQHAELRVHLKITDTHQALAALRSGEVELAVVGGAVNSVDVDGHPVGEDEVVLVAAPQIARAFRAEGASVAERLQELPLVLREPGSGTRATALEALEACGVDVDRLRICLEIGSNAALREAAVAGLGAAFISRLCVEADVASGRLEILNVFASPVRRTFLLITPAGRTLSPAARELKRALQSGVKPA